ncbi:CatB-related O-acetyltransferase [Aestuariicoccus sp. MJ-SS9]|uniref:CatB-related O-acetyltransferase n=1 Tax=Aestuariicoccus sp. MJ-SS9 TaxID=3079855 RepID=UPI00290B1739|nr:CatB-related O-acetyltransferase [Aestuariicoccus sp. MJ-SS9]MDU8910332.1 CatB-related O-acetyltransferase [Aestuariicoccus sp. MJ-SS9]
MAYSLPDADCVHPITLPDGSAHPGTVFLRNVIDMPNVEIGAYTYASDFDPPDEYGWAARLAPYLFGFSQERLIIGKFCQIAHGVRFIGASANHETRGLSTFPFAVFNPETMLGYQPDTRDTVIGHDVWLGYGAKVLPGARIGNGVIVGAGAVVRGDIPDYAIVTGNPAQVVRMRFAPKVIARLNALAWWDWPIDRIVASRAALEAGDIDALTG